MSSSFGADVSAAASLSILSFLASIVQGSTSLGDGIFLQITWGILMSIAPNLTNESSLGADGIRIITLFMYVRMVVMTPYLLWRLWKGHQKRQAEEVTSPASVSSIDTLSSPTKRGLFAALPPHIFSIRLFWLLMIPNTVWCILGVVILKGANSGQIALCMGILCITFSTLYVGLKLWNLSASDGMPKLLKSILSPRFLVEGTKDQITIPAQVCCFIAFNLAGLMTALAGIGGPPMMVTIVLFSIPMDLTRFTFPIGTLVGAFLRLIFAVYYGVLKVELWPFYLPATVFGLIGLDIGVRIGNVLSPSTYSAAIFLLLNLAGIVMLTSNLFVTVPALLGAIGALLVMHFGLFRSASPADAEAAVKDLPPIVDEVVTSVSSFEVQQKEDTDRRSFTEIETLENALHFSC
eukprot:GILI01023587.1.p1 GENE.GILI01023587.1~~GILI01023587.1.p1  ORF type:complete len:407 (+),score=19.67 GILI01023587.1:30-1250(+)